MVPEFGLVFQQYNVQNGRCYHSVLQVCNVDNLKWSNSFCISLPYHNERVLSVRYQNIFSLLRESKNRTIFVIIVNLFFFSYTHSI